MPNSKRIVLYTASGVLTGYIMDTSSKDGVVELQKIVEYEEHRYFEMEAIEAAEGCDGLFVTQRNKMLQYWKFDNPSPLWNQVVGLFSIGYFYTIVHIAAFFNSGFTISPS